MGKRVFSLGKREIIYLSLHCHHQNDSCIKTGSDESHFNVSLSVRDKVTRQCPQTTTFEEKGEPKRIRNELSPEEIRLLFYLLSCQQWGTADAEFKPPPPPPPKQKEERSKDRQLTTRGGNYLPRLVHSLP